MQDILGDFLKFSVTSPLGLLALGTGRGASATARVNGRKIADRPAAAQSLCLLGRCEWLAATTLMITAEVDIRHYCRKAPTMTVKDVRLITVIASLERRSHAAACEAESIVR